MSNLYAARREAAIRRAARIGAGLCTECGKAPARPGKRYCQPCADIATERSMNRFRRRKEPCIRLGICPRCGLRQAMPGVKVCGVCSERTTGYKATLRAKYKAEGRCVRCGHGRDREDRSLCKGCREKPSHPARARTAA